MLASKEERVRGNEREREREPTYFVIAIIVSTRSRTKMLLAFGTSCSLSPSLSQLIGRKLCQFSYDCQIEGNIPNTCQLAYA